jgi:translation initiation factor 1
MLPDVGDRKNPFAALEALRDKLPPGTAREKLEARGPARAVVRLERKGRAGKDVTVVEKLDLAGAELERWARELKGALGVGGGVEEGRIVLQGDVRARVEPALLARGVRKVVRG